MERVVQPVSCRAGAQLALPCVPSHGWRGGIGMGPGLRRVPKKSHPRLGRADSLSPDSADAARGQRPGA